jgi:hypothetical protein
MNENQADQADTTDTVPAVPPAQPDAFSAVMRLVELVLDPREFAGKLAELKATEDRVAKELRRLELARQSHDRALLKDREEIAKERVEIASHWNTVQAEKAGLEEWKVKIAEFRRAHPNAGIDTHRYEDLPGGGVRDWGEGGRWRDDSARPLDDPVYDDTRPAAPADEMVTERVPGPPDTTLHRSTPKPRRSMRRRADA